MLNCNKNLVIIGRNHRLWNKSARNYQLKTIQYNNCKQN